MPALKAHHYLRPMTHDPLQLLRERFLTAMQAAFGDRLPETPDPLIGASRNPEFGDFQSNAAMPLAKALREKPRAIAETIVEHLDLSGLAQPLTDESIAGPGFINIRLAPEALAQFLAELDTPELGVEAPAKPETVVVDLCGVNLAKQMHVGHLRATVIGDALARTFERLGHRAVRQNHLGDWGLPIAMVAARIQSLHEAGELDLESLSLDELDRLYRAAQRECAIGGDERALKTVEEYGAHPKILDEITLALKPGQAARARSTDMLLRLQSGDEEALGYWRRVYEITMSECLRTCERLQATVTAEHTAGESTYRDDLPEIIADLESRKIAVESQGALVVRLDEFGIAEPLLVRKSDGGFLYATTDLAGIRRRVQKLGGDRLIYAVDARQSLHFKQVFAAAKKAGYARTVDGSEAALEHAAFGTVLGEDGSPFKTRSGENVKLADLLDEAVRRAEEAVEEKNPSLSPAVRSEVAEAIGIGAIKYADLSSDRVKDYMFNFDRMLAFEGDTGPYLQYAYVRVRSIFRKAKSELGIDPARFEAAAPDRSAFIINAPEEKALALALLRFPATLEAVAEHLEPHRLCGYLYDVATSFSSFFQACPVLRAEDDETRLSRLRLCALTGRVLRDGLMTLGITPLEQM